MVKPTLLSTLAVFTGVASAHSSHRTRHAHRFGHSIRIRGNNSTEPPPGYTQVAFLDDFSSGTLDTINWQYDLGTSYPGGPENWGTGEKQTYTDDVQNINVNSNGNLAITPRKNGDQWTSARIETTENVNVIAPVGGKLYVEANIKIGTSGLEESKQMGIWPAFWMMGVDFRNNYDLWPSIGEIDIMETANGQSEIAHTVHCDVAPGGICNEFNGIGIPTKVPFSRGEWHTVAAEIDRSNEDWQQQSLNFYVDRQQTWSVGPSDFAGSEQVWQALTESGKLILLNVAVGGGYADGINGGQPTPDENTLDGEQVGMEIEYVAAWTT